MSIPTTDVIHSNYDIHLGCPPWRFLAITSANPLSVVGVFPYFRHFSLFKLKFRHWNLEISDLWRHREFSSTNSESASQGLSDPVVEFKIRPALSASRTPYKCERTWALDVSALILHTNPRNILSLHVFFIFDSAWLR